jgi:hypothetical protein
MELPAQMLDCLIWDSQAIDVARDKAANSDNRNVEPCICVQVRERMDERLMIGVREDSPTFRDSVFYKTIKQLIDPHLEKGTKSAD